MKKLLGIVIATCMVFLLSGSIAFADVQVNKVYIKIDKLDARVQSEIDRAVARGNDLMKDYYANIAKNPELTQVLTDNLNLQIDNIITELVNKTNAMVQTQLPVFEKQGVDVESYYITVTIGNETVLIDPSKTVGI